MTLEQRLKDVFADVATDIHALQQAGGGGGSLPPWTTLEVDLGPAATMRHVFVAVPGMVPSAKVEVMRSPLPATGKGSDEYEAEPAMLAAFAKTDGFDLHVHPIGCSIGGKMNINYRVS